MRETIYIIRINYNSCYMITYWISYIYHSSLNLVLIVSWWDTEFEYKNFMYRFFILFSILFYSELLKIQVNLCRWWETNYWVQYFNVFSLVVNFNFIVIFQLQFVQYYDFNVNVWLDLITVCVLDMGQNL